MSCNCSQENDQLHAEEPLHRSTQKYRNGLCQVYQDAQTTQVSKRILTGKRRSRKENCQASGEIQQSLWDSYTKTCRNDTKNIMKPGKTKALLKFYFDNIQLRILLSRILQHHGNFWGQGQSQNVQYRLLVSCFQQQ